MRFHRELDDTRSFGPRSPTQVGRHRATRGARDRGGQPSSRLQQSMEISGTENIDRAVEEGKRRYERALP
jgi:hypothetical protein